MVSKVTYKVRLDSLIDTSGLTTIQKQDISKELGEYLQDKILEDVSNEKSPVSGKKWDALTTRYKKIKSKIAGTSANLELHGDMLDALEYETYRDGFEIGVFDSDQAQKADNHNKFSAKSKKTALPKRQFVPQKDEKYRSAIMEEVASIARELRDARENDTDIKATPANSIKQDNIKTSKKIFKKNPSYEVITGKTPKHKTNIVPEGGKQKPEKKQNPEEEVLKYAKTRSELFSFRGYTKGGFREINTYLRTGSKEYVDDARKKTIDKEIQDIDNVLKRVPKHEGKTFRAVTFASFDENGPKSFLNSHKEGSLVRYDSYTSTTKNSDIAKKFSSDAKFGRPMEKQDYIIEIKSKTGKDISSISTDPEEEEVLFERNKKFMVKKVKIGAGPNKSTIIEMEEI